MQAVANINFLYASSPQNLVVAIFGKRDIFYRQTGQCANGPMTARQFASSGAHHDVAPRPGASTLGAAAQLLKSRL